MRSPLAWLAGTRLQRPFTDPTAAPLLDAESLAGLAARVAHGPASPTLREVAHPRLGDSPSPQRGSGMDYDDSRPYQPGDDPRAIDWRLLARSGEMYVKRFREERRPLTFILIDRRAAMRFGTRTRLKVTQAARIAALAAFDAQRRRSELGGLLLEGEARWLPTRHSTDAARRLAALAASPAPPLDRPGPALEPLLAELAGLLVRGSRVWLISDFHDLGPEARGHLLHLAAEHELRAVQVIDPAERQLPPLGTLQLHPCHGGPAVILDSSDPRQARHYAERAAAAHAERQNYFRDLAIPFARIDVRSDHPELEMPW